MSEFHQFIVPDPLEANFAWRVRYYASSGRSYWMKMYVDGYGRLIPVNSFVPAAEDPTDDNDPDDYGGLA